MMNFTPALRASAEEKAANVTNAFKGNEVEQNSAIKDPVNIMDNNLQEGDFNILSGDGKLTYNPDGSVTFGVTSTQKNRIVYNKMDKIKNGIFEADITPDRDAMNRFGILYRVQDASAYTYVGTGDANNQYFGEIFGPANTWTSMTTDVPLKANQTYHMKLKFIDNVATLYIDDKKVNSWDLTGGVDQPGLLGFEKSRGAANITISNIKIKEIVPQTPPNTAPIEDTLSSKYMDVIIDQVFPRVVEYKVGNKMMNGQETPVYGLKVNGNLYYPEVAYKKISSSEALYTLKVVDEEENLDAIFKVSLKVDNNKVIYQFDDIKNNGSAKIETVEFPDMNFISVNSNQKDANAKLTNLSSDVTKSGDVDVVVDSSMSGIGTSNTYYTAFLSTNELSAGVWSSSEVNGYRNLVAKRYETENGAKAMGIGSSLLYYQRGFMPEPQASKPTIKIAIADDLNHDNEINWQDGAIAYRDIMQTIKGYEDVNNNVGMRIAMNFGSQAQQPFLKTLDNVKKVALATDGLGQSVLLKGYANEGHDSGHPDYGDVGERMGGAKDLNTLINEGHKYDAQFGVHINAQETYPEAKAFSNDFIDGPNSLGWGWLDQSYTINKLKDLYSGTRAKRLDDLKAAVPGLDYVYLDVWYQDQWESDRIAEQFMDRGWRVSTEFGTAVPNYSTWQHWAVDKNYGGPTSKGINSDVLRFISNHQKDSWVLNAPDFGGTADHPLLGGYELAGFEGWQSDKNFDNFIKTTFDTNLPTKFLQKYYVTNWITEKGDKSKTNLEKEIKLADPSNGDVVDVKRKDNSRERVITLNGNVILDEHAYLIPWVKQDFKTPTPDSQKLYHWNLNGGTTTWTLPDEYKNVHSVFVYKLTDQGRTEKKSVKVVNNQITLTADPATPYVVVPKNGKDKGVQIDDWSKNSHVYDTGFNSGTIKDKYTKVSGDKEAVSVKRTDQTGSARNVSSGDYYLSFDSPTQYTSITRTLTDLEAGKEYVAEVYVENNSDAKAEIKVSNGKNEVSNYTLRSLQKNYVKADSHASNDGYNSKMQIMQVSFTATNKTAQLTLAREAVTGAGTSAYVGDTILPYLKEKLDEDKWDLQSVPTTTLVSNPYQYLKANIPTLLVSFARSGNSPESVAAVELAQKIVTNFYQLTITCAQDGELAKRSDGNENNYLLLMPEKANDQGFAMTGSYSCMTLAALLIFDPLSIEEKMEMVKKLCLMGENVISMEENIQKIVDTDFERIIYLGAGSLEGLTREAQLKILELTAGQVVTAFDSPLGFRHGPKSFVNERALVFVFVSNHPYTRQYDLDILNELKQDDIANYICAIQVEGETNYFGDGFMFGSEAQSIPDAYLALPYIIVGQTIALLSSIKVGNKPDTPSPTGTVNRVVKGVTIHKYCG